MSNSDGQQNVKKKGGVKERHPGSKWTQNMKYLKENDYTSAES